MLLWLFILLLTQLHVLAGPTQKKCTEKLDIPSTASCCKLPDIAFKPYDKQCGHMDLALPNWPCKFDCVYKAAEVLNGTQLKLDKVDAMMYGLLKDHQKLRELFSEGFVKCKAQEEKIVLTLKRRRYAKMAKCYPLALLYGICAYKHVFLYCPTENWTNSSMCNRIRGCELSKLA